MSVTMGGGGIQRHVAAPVQSDLRAETARTSAAVCLAAASEPSALDRWGNEREQQGK